MSDFFRSFLAWLLIAAITASPCAMTGMFPGSALAASVQAQPNAKAGQTKQKPKTAAKTTQKTKAPTKSSTQTKGQAKGGQKKPAAGTSQKKAAGAKKTGQQAKKSGQQTKKAAPTGKTVRKKAASKVPGNNFKGAVVYNTSTKQIVFERRANVQVPPASLTKILAMYTALDIMKAKKISPATKVKVSARAAGKGGSRMGLRAGDVVTIDQLFHGMAIVSGNDAATALAEHFGKTEAGFVSLMNKKARQLGMKRSTFKNASGLPAKGQFTTARDMLLLARRYLADYPKNLAKYHAFRTYTYKGQTGGNANPLLGSFKGADGLKTGFVNASGYNLIATSNRGGVRLIGVLLGAPTSKVRSEEITALMEAGYGKKASMVASTGNKKAANAKQTAAAKPKTAAKTAPPSSAKQPARNKASGKAAAPAKATPKKNLASGKTVAQTKKAAPKSAATASGKQNKGKDSLPIRQKTSSSKARQ